MKSQAPVQREANIDGEDCIVSIVRSGKATWKAWGGCSGHRVDATGTSESSAYAHWKANAKLMNG